MPKALLMQEEGVESSCSLLLVYLVMDVETENHVQAILLYVTRQDRSAASIGAISQALAFLLMGLGRGLPMSSWSRNDVRSPAKVST